MTEEKTYSDIFHLFYKLKHQYEERIEREKNKLIKNASLSTDEKRHIFKTYKRKCVNCGQLGGTLFEQNKNILEARCLAEKPCKLHIKLQRSDYVLINKYDIKLKDDIQDEKSQIITNKLNYLFGYQTEKSTLEKFNLIKQKIIKLVKEYEIVNRQYVDIANNEEQKADIRRMNTELLLLIDGMKILLKQYEVTTEDKFITEAVELYVTKILSLQNRLMKAKYKSTEIQPVQINKDTTIFHLRQEQNTMKDLMYQIGSNNKILSNKK